MPDLATLDHNATVTTLLDSATQPADTTVSLPGPTKVESYHFHYEGPDFRPRYYEVRADLFSDHHVAVNVHYDGQISGPWPSVAHAEWFIHVHNHQVRDGHEPGTCQCNARQLADDMYAYAQFVVEVHAGIHRHA